MKLKSTILAAAVAGALAVPLAAQAQSQGSSWSSTQFNQLDTNGDGFLSRSEWERYGAPQRQSLQQRSAQGGAAPDLVVITMTPVEQRMLGEQRRESMFRAIDANGDGSISPAEAGLNTQLMSAFSTLDRNSNGRIERQEFAKVHVDDGSRQASAAGGSSGSTAREGVPSRRIEEKSKFSSGSMGGAGSSGDEAERQGSAAGGGSAGVDAGRYATEGPPSRAIEERSKFSGVKPRRAAPQDD